MVTCTVRTGLGKMWHKESGDYGRDSFSKLDIKLMCIIVTVVLKYFIFYPTSLTPTLFKTL